MALQKSVDRDEHRTKKPYDLAQKKYKYQKKYNLLASSTFNGKLTQKFEVPSNPISPFHRRVEEEGEKEQA